MHRALSSLSLPIALLLATPASAQDNADSPRNVAPHHFAITLEPVPVAFGPFARYGLEARITDRVSASALFGYGSAWRLHREPTRAYELGTQLRYYIHGTFDTGNAWHIGVEALYRHAITPYNGDIILAPGPGLILTPFIGPKFTFPFGFTGFASVGIAYRAWRESISTDPDENRRVGVMMRAGFGWSF
jgi:hypothetical protein